MAAETTKQDSVHTIKPFLGTELAHRAATDDSVTEILGQIPSVHTIKSSLGNELSTKAAGFY
jgi:hypothetical protein